MKLKNVFPYHNFLSFILINAHDLNTKSYHVLESFVSFLLKKIIVKLRRQSRRNHAMCRRLNYILIIVTIMYIQLR